MSPLLEPLVQSLHRSLLESSNRPGPHPTEPTTAVYALAGTAAEQVLALLWAYAHLEISMERLSELLGVNIAEVQFLDPLTRVDP